jgi:hypothetical protein
MTRTLRVRCHRAESALDQAAAVHGHRLEPEVDWAGVSFRVRVDDDRPVDGPVVLDVMGRERAVEVRATYAVVPTSREQPAGLRRRPHDRALGRRSAVTLFLHPYCTTPTATSFVHRGRRARHASRRAQQVAAGDSDSNWHYRTATSSGTERTTIWATDVLGARSADAELESRSDLGSTSCRPVAGRPTAKHEVFSRPGAVRRFAVL